MLECRLYLRPGSPAVSEIKFMEHLSRVNELPGKEHSLRYNTYKGKNYFCFIPDRIMLTDIQARDGRPLYFGATKSFVWFGRVIRPEGP